MFMVSDDEVCVNNKSSSDSECDKQDIYLFVGLFSELRGINSSVSFWFVTFPVGKNGKFWTLVSS